MYGIVKRIYTAPLVKRIYTAPPKCNNCRYRLNINGEQHCKLFKILTFSVSNATFDYYVDTQSAREDENLCGFYGKYFKSI